MKIFCGEGGDVVRWQSQKNALQGRLIARMVKATFDTFFHLREIKRRPSGMLRA